MLPWTLACLWLALVILIWVQLHGWFPLLVCVHQEFLGQSSPFFYPEFSHLLVYILSISAQISHASPYFSEFSLPVTYFLPQLIVHSFIRWLVMRSKRSSLYLGTTHYLCMTSFITPSSLYVSLLLLSKHQGISMLPDTKVRQCGKWFSTNWRGFGRN